MPMYEYRCEACGEEFEAIVRITEKDDVDCPECGAKAKKLVSAFALGGGDSRGGASGGGGCYSGG